MKRKTVIRELNELGTIQSILTVEKSKITIKNYTYSKHELNYILGQYWGRKFNQKKLCKIKYRRICINPKTSIQFAYHPY